MTDPCLHLFTEQPSEDRLPKRFTYPFHYTPHALIEHAATLLKAFLQEQAGWQEELRRGKMFGVLVVRTLQDEIGFLAAFSGLLCGTNHLPFFVPPVVDLLDPDGFFKVGERGITALNKQIAHLQQTPEYLDARNRLEQLEAEASASLSGMKEEYRQAKQQRDRMRASASAEELGKMNRESQFQKAEIKRAEKMWAERISEQRGQLALLQEEISRLKNERKTRSEALQQEIFRRFVFFNARHEQKNLIEIFQECGLPVPPAGSGECAAPKMLQYAYAHQYTPLAMGEFWWGDSPKGEIRHHGRFYPSCTSKCKPILGFMLQGLDVDPDPIAEEASRHSEVEILYEDEELVAVSKPAGMYSVPGKNEDVPSVLSWARKRYPDADSPLLVHRLDMHTSGILLIGKTKRAFVALQQMFETHTIKKTYEAILEGRVAEDEGVIRLPLCADLANRPMQRVDEQYGKPAVTQYKVLERIPAEGGHGERTRVCFYPQTGRTHQLRVHSAHHEGLSCPILGDELYGNPSDRLYLHAARISFEHPVTHKRVHISCKVPF